MFWYKQPKGWESHLEINIRNQYHMRLLLLAISLLCLCYPYIAMAQNITPTDIRGLIWGLPPEIVKQHEKTTFLGQEGNYLLYLDEIYGLRTTISYGFKDDKLAHVQYFMNKKYFIHQKRLDDFMMIKQGLIAQYGQPVDEDLIWRNRETQNFPDEWGWGVYRGELFIKTYWQTSDTNIVLYLGAKTPYKPQLFVTFSPLQSSNS